MKAVVTAALIAGAACLLSGCKGKVEEACESWDAKAKCSCAQDVFDKLTEGAKDKEQRQGLLIAAFRKDKLGLQNYSGQLGLVTSMTFGVTVSQALHDQCGFSRVP